jgi:hypothetical protein
LCTLKLKGPLVATVHCWYILAVLSSQGVPKNGTEEAMEQEMKSVGTIERPSLLFYDEDDP